MKIVLYTNIMTPYRKYFYDLFYKECISNGDTFLVLVMAKNENNRSWFFENFEAPYARLLNGKTISHDETYIHFNYHLNKILKSINPDIVIASGSYLCPGTWKIAKLSKKLNYKVLFWSESHLGEVRNYGGIKIYLREYMRSIFYKKFDGFLCPGKLAFNFIDKYTKNDAKKIFLPNLIDEEAYKSPQKDIIKLCSDYHDEGKTILFSPVRLSPVKGLSPFMDLLAKCRNKESAVILVAGSGELKDELESKAKKLHLNIVFLGGKTSREVATLYKNVDVFCLPSLSDPNPLTCIEALWSGKPLIISNHVGNYPEVVKNGINGYVFKYDDEENAIKKIEMIIDSNEEWRKKAKEESLNIAKKTYNSKNVTKRVRTEIYQLL